jgi:hypothetical protein
MALLNPDHKSYLLIGIRDQQARMTVSRECENIVSLAKLVLLSKSHGYVLAMLLSSFGVIVQKVV